MPDTETFHAVEPRPFLDEGERRRVMVWVARLGVFAVAAGVGAAVLTAPVPAGVAAYGAMSVAPPVTPQQAPPVVVTQVLPPPASPVARVVTRTRWVNPPTPAPASVEVPVVVSLAAKPSGSRASTSPRMTPTLTPTPTPSSSGSPSPKPSPPPDGMGRAFMVGRHR